LKTFPAILFFAALITLTGCGVTQPIRPLEEGTTEIISSFGGPIIPVGNIAFPVPYLNVGFMHGYTSDITLYSNAHITALLYKDIGLDGGFATSFLQEKGIQPELTLNMRGYFFWNAFRGSSVRFFPMGTLTASYETGGRSLFYFGADNLYQFQTSDIFISPFIGYSFPLSDAMVMQVESKWLAMNRDTRRGIFEGFGSIAGKGNAGLFVGIQYKITK